HCLTDDGPDGVDTASWIGNQNWSNGKIGMIETSYMGGTQHAFAMSRSPELITVMPIDAASNMGYQSLRNAGAFELRLFNGLLLSFVAEGSRQSRDPAAREVLTDLATNRRLYLMNLPLRRGTAPLQYVPLYEKWLVEAMRHGANGDFWKQNAIIDFPDQY